MNLSELNDIILEEGKMEAIMRFLKMLVLSTVSAAVFDLLRKQFEKSYLKSSQKTDAH